MNGGEESVQEYLLKWITFLFQNPEKKPKTAVVFHSKEGNGKNEFLGSIGKLMGNATYLETSNAERDIFEKQSLALQGRKLVFINEMNKNIHKNYEDRMKGLITDVSLDYAFRRLSDALLHAFLNFGFRGCHIFLVSIIAVSSASSPPARVSQTFTAASGDSFRFRVVEESSRTRVVGWFSKCTRVLALPMF